jgi:hypothetical protein
MEAQGECGNGVIDSQSIVSWAVGQFEIVFLCGRRASNFDSSSIHKRGREMSKQFAQVILAVLFFVSAAWAQQSPFAGTWKLNPSKSQFGDSPRSSETIVLSQSGDQLKSSSDITYEGGAKVHTEWSATLDGKPYRLMGDGHYDTILITKIDERTLKAVSKKADIVSKSSQWAISSDGNTMTRIQKVTNAKGQDVDNVIVFDKQP